jgi:hypothetical protein
MPRSGRRGEGHAHVAVLPGSYCGYFERARRAGTGYQQRAHPRPGRAAVVQAPCFTRGLPGGYRGTVGNVNVGHERLARPRPCTATSRWIVRAGATAGWMRGHPRQPRAPFMRVRRRVRHRRVRHVQADVSLQLVVAGQTSCRSPHRVVGHDRSDRLRTRRVSGQIKVTHRVPGPAPRPSPTGEPARCRPRRRRTRAEPAIPEETSMAGATVGRGCAIGRVVMRVTEERDAINLVDD